MCVCVIVVSRVFFTIVSPSITTPVTLVPISACHFLNLAELSSVFLKLITHERRKKKRIGSLGIQVKQNQQLSVFFFSNYMKCRAIVCFKNPNEIRNLLS